MKTLFKKYIYLILFPALFVACTRDDTQPDQPKFIKITEAVSSGSSFNIVMYAKDSLFVGYNKVFFKITDKVTGAVVNQATIVLHPLMDMVTFSHACPFENPDNSVNSEGYFEGAILFSMPGSGNSWSLTNDVTANGKSETASFPIDKVIATTPVQKIVVMDTLFTGPGTWTITKYPMSLVKPESWKVGNNTFEITVHTMASMMSFPSCSDLTIEITPEMPSMGHGSPNNVNPVYVANGHYAGVVNFTMTGAWRINMVVKKGTRVISNKSYFDIVF